MIFFGDALKPLHDVCREMKASLDKDKLPTKAELNEWLEKNSEAAKAMNKRMYIYTTAMAKGWAFAKKLEFYEAGKHSTLLWYHKLVVYNPSYFLGENSYENYDKVEKWFAKREEKMLDKGYRGSRGSRGRGRHFGSHYHPYWNSNHHAPATFPNYPSQVPNYPPPSLPQSQPSYTPPSAAVSRPPVDKSRLRCNKCQELGHLFRECPNQFVAK
jgi:hypothetical protein